jgi:kynureninase
VSDPAEDARLLAWRDELPIVGRTVHLVNHSLGPMPRAVEAELAEFAAQWRERGVRAWSEGWWESAVTTGDLLAPILGVAPGSVAMHPNVSVALTVLLSAFDYPRSRRRIVTTELDFHTVHYVLHGEARRGAEIVAVPAAEDGLSVDSDRLLETIDRATRLVVISHVLYRSSFLLDAEAVARRCREVGAILVLDVYQSTGVVPLDLARWGVDAAVGGSVKWLCGGPGAGFLYVRPGLAAELEPAAIGWQADVEPFGFRAGPVRLADGAWRFLTGTPAVACLFACRPGYRMIREVGTDSVRRRSIALTETLIRAADEHGLEVRTPRDPERRGGTVTIEVPDATRVTEGLLADGILCDHRPGSGIRFGPHFFNTAEECTRAVGRAAELMRGGT